MLGIGAMSLVPGHWSWSSCAKSMFWPFTVTSHHWLSINIKTQNSRGFKLEASVIWTCKNIFAVLREFKHVRFSLGWTNVRERVERPEPESVGSWPRPQSEAETHNPRPWAQWELLSRDEAAPCSAAQCLFTNCDGRWHWPIVSEWWQRDNGGNNNKA